MTGILIFLGVLLIGIILIQRGKGGGLAGAFGGVGGSSPFGAKAGDDFTKYTLILALIWVLVIMGQVKLVQWDTRRTLEAPTSSFGSDSE